MKARVFLSLALALPAAAHSFTVQMMHVTPEGIGQLAGTVVIEDSAAGARLTPDLRPAAGSARLSSAPERRLRPDRG